MYSYKLYNMLLDFQVENRRITRQPSFFSLDLHKMEVLFFFLDAN